MRSSYKILVLNGPNLRHLGERQPSVYGRKNLHDLKTLLERCLGRRTDQVEFELAQHDSEGDMIKCLEEARTNGVDGVVLNAGAYTHTSLALADCLAWIGLPMVEVHLSNIFSRQEKIRHESLLAPYCIGLISGFGIDSYALAVNALLAHLNADAYQLSGLEFFLA
jgi:3-dehydroquinate dehydratase-2